MSSSTRRSAAPLIVLAAGAAIGLSGCITPPPLPTTPPAQAPRPSESVDPVESSAAPTPSGTPAAGGELPELVELNTVLPAGTLPGWETSIITDAAFELQSGSDFPAGPTINVLESATGCTFWAYQGTQDGDSTDETANSEETLGILSESSPDDWEPDVFELGPSASQGVAVEMLSIIAEDDAGVSAWFARNFQSSGTTSSIVADCPADAGGIDHIDAVVGEHFQINFLQP